MVLAEVHSSRKESYTSQVLNTDQLEDETYHQNNVHTKEERKTDQANEKFLR